MNSNSVLREKIPLYLMLVVGLILFSNTALAANSGENMTQPDWSEEHEAYLISNITELNWIRTAPKEDYKLTDDINATETQNWNNGKGWEPVGEQNYEFHGTLNGKGNTIYNLTIDRPSASRAGLIGYAGASALIKNIKVENFNVTSYRTTGPLAGINYGEIREISVNNSLVYGKGNYGNGENVGGIAGLNYGSIQSVSFDGKIRGGGEIGGIAGVNAGDINGAFAEINFTSSSIMQVGGITGINRGNIENSSTKIDLSGDISFIGGVAGQNSGDIFDSRANGSINVSDYYAGGIVGESEDGTISRSKATVDVIGTTKVGGIAGSNSGYLKGVVYEGDIKGDEYVGGITGINTGDEYDTFVIENSYSKGSVSGNKSVGGLVGYNDDGGKISRAYSANLVDGDTYAGGLVGWNVGEVSISFWDIEASGTSESDGGEGKNTVEMKSSEIYQETGNGEVLELETDESKEITVNGTNITIETVYIVNDNTAVSRINGLLEQFNQGETFTVDNLEGKIQRVDPYEGDGNGSVLYTIGVEGYWMIESVNSSDKANTGYTWNIVENKTYPFLSWEGNVKNKVPESYNLNIQVKNKVGNSVENASVKIDSYNEETDGEGLALFEDLVESDYTAIVDKEGYHENSTQFSLTEDDQNETVVLEELSSAFSITDINLSSDNVDKGETVEANITVNNTGSERGRRDVSLKVGEESFGTKETNLEPDSSEKLSFDFSINQEGEFNVTAEIFEDSKSKGLLVGPKKYDLNLSSTPAEAGSLSPEIGIYTYEEGDAVTLNATAEPGWKFKEWNGLDKETNEVTLTMDEDKDIEALFEEDIDISIEEIAAPQTINGEIDFNYQIANQQEEITDNFTVKLNGREVSKTEKTVSKGVTLNEKAPTVNPVAGDGSESATLEIEYAGITDSRSFRIASIKRDFVEGWNYFSLPIATSQTRYIEEVFGQDEINTIWTYENGWKNYYPGAPDNQFDTIEGGQGYIVESEEDFSITPIVQTNLSAVESDDPVKPAQNNLDLGWNLIGSYWTTGIRASGSGAYSSLPDGYVTSTLYTENDGSLSLLELGNKDIEPGKAYWISSKDGAAYTKSQESK